MTMHAVQPSSQSHPEHATTATITRRTCNICTDSHVCVPATFSFTSQASEPSTVLKRGPLTLDLSRRTAHLFTNEIDLKPREYDLLVALMRANGKLLSRDAILDLVWGFEFEGSERTIDVHVRRLRFKFEQLDRRFGGKRLIQTSVRHGYKLDVEALDSA